MQTGTPSKTAYAAACHRAIHQLLDKACIFTDNLAIPIIGEEVITGLAEGAKDDVDKRKMRFFIALRNRFMEDSLWATVNCGLRQVVVLGAGLDTLACRAVLPDHVQIFEVDHPATQAWKRERLKETGIGEPENLTFAAIDFEQQSLADGLVKAGFREGEETFFSCLGVVPYLKEETVLDILGFVAGMAGSHVVFDFGEPAYMRSSEAQTYLEKRSADVALIGEPWVTFFEPAFLQSRMKEIGFDQFEDVTLSDLLGRYLPGRRNSSGNSGAHLLRASVKV
jgi:methyltransferase (TIGR00027 family)